MKNQIAIAAMSLITLFLLISLTGIAQEEKKEKQVTIKRVEVEDGKKVVKDTTFTVKEGEKVNEIIRTVSWVSDDDSTHITADIFIDEERCKEGKKVMIIKKEGDNETIEEFIIPSGHKGQKKVMKFKSDDGEEVVMVMPRKHRKAMVWSSDDDFEYEFDTEEFEVEMEAHMDELEDIEIEMIRRPKSPKRPYFETHHINRFEHAVTDKELRDAGIKNKPDRLDLDELDIDNNEGVITLKFTISGEASPKVEVYNFFGDQVFSGKPEVVNGTYKLVVDLSQKQHGTYYLQIINKNSSLTEKIRL